MASVLVLQQVSLASECSDDDVAPQSFFLGWLTDGFPKTKTAQDKTELIVLAAGVQ